MTTYRNYWKNIILGMEEEWKKKLNYMPKGHKMHRKMVRKLFKRTEQVNSGLIHKDGWYI